MQTNRKIECSFKSNAEAWCEEGIAYLLASLFADNANEWLEAAARCFQRAELNNQHKGN